MTQMIDSVSRKRKSKTIAAKTSSAASPRELAEDGTTHGSTVMLRAIETSLVYATNVSNCCSLVHPHAAKTAAAAAAASPLLTYVSPLSSSELTVRGTCLRAIMYQWASKW